MAQHDERETDRSRALKTLDRLREAQVDKAIAACASSPEGRRFLWFLLQEGKVGTQPFTSNALNTSFNCGELNVGNKILSRITAVDPAIYVRMQQENQNEHREFSARFDDAGNAIRPVDDSSAS